MDKSKLTKTETCKPRGVKETVHKKILAGQTDNSAYYCDVLWQLRENVRRLCPNFWRQKNLLLHHDNALSYASFFTRKFLTKTNITVNPTNPTPLTWSPAAFLFPRLKMPV
jgi:hypothetical protein